MSFGVKKSTDAESEKGRKKGQGTLGSFSPSKSKENESGRGDLVEDGSEEAIEEGLEDGDEREDDEAMESRSEVVSLPPSSRPPSPKSVISFGDGSEPLEMEDDDENSR